MKYFNFRTISVIFPVILFAACSKNGSNPKTTNNTPKVTITSLDVTSGPYNTEVRITGTGFDENVKNDSVFFNGKAAIIEYGGTSTQLIVDVPLVAGTGAVTVKADGVEATGPVFTYVPALVVTTFAGNKFLYGYTDGASTSALFNNLESLTIDKDGNLYAGDAGNHVIRKITPQGVVSTFAGSGKAGNADGPASSASFMEPRGLTVDQAGNIYIADAGGSFIRKITPDGNVSTIAGDGLTHANDGVGNGASFDEPSGVAVDANGNLYIADLGNHEIRKITSDGTVTTIAGSAINPGTTDGTGANASFNAPWGIIYGIDGNLYVIDSYQGPVRKIILPNTVSRIGTSSYIQPEGLAMDALGNLYVSSTVSQTIVETTPGGTSKTIAGNSGNPALTDGVASQASFAFPAGIVVDKSGNIFIADSNAIREISFQ